MKRYQVYLNADAVSVLDEFEQVTKISRSKLIREAIDQLSNNLRLILNEKKILPTKKSSLERLIGIIPSSPTEITDFARRSDREYIRD